MKIIRYHVATEAKTVDECTSDLEKQAADDSVSEENKNVISLFTVEQPKCAEAVPRVNIPQDKVSKTASCVISKPRPLQANKEQQNLSEVQLTAIKESVVKENLGTVEAELSKRDEEMPLTKKINPAKGDSHACDQELVATEELQDKTRKKMTPNKHKTKPDTETANSDDKGQLKKTVKKQKKTTKRRKLAKTTKTNHNDSESDDGINIILPTIEDQRRFAETASNITKVQRFQKMLQRTGLGDTMWKYYVLDYREVWARTSREQDQGVGRDSGRWNWRGRGRGLTRGRGVEMGRGHGLEDSGRGEHVVSGRRMQMGQGRGVDVGRGRGVGVTRGNERDKGRAGRGTLSGGLYCPELSRQPGKEVPHSRVQARPRIAAFPTRGHAHQEVFPRGVQVQVDKRRPEVTLQVEKED
ncbi:hypothetical protein E2C01_028178 [Portunus trituberculatus]|uniref:Uncharacterized protein n=1 Tax=Portunus trituberculatus TaxID=210409 RepID=A0A5B7END0_PORTR|nr:hypothetical protein [Portunus trituberculatus]